MKRSLAHIPLLLTACIPLTSQEVVPPAGDSTAVRGVERTERQSAIDSLAAGRRRWRAARILEYRLQTSHRCFCVPDPADSLRAGELFTVRDGRITERSRGKGPESFVPNTSWTVDSLFDIVEADLVNDWRRARRLELHPTYGFPLGYFGDGVRYEDAWIEITVDSFAVVRAATAKRRR